MITKSEAFDGRCPVPGHQPDDSFQRVEDVVRDAFVVAAKDGATPNLERLLVTLLAAVVTNPESPKLSEGRAAELAELLVLTVKEVHRISSKC